jgi:hypothetical protein
MNEFLNSLKADLLDRRLLPILALVGVGLVAALAYVALGGGGKASAPMAPTPSAHVPAGIATSEAPAHPAQGVAETTSGSSVQRHGYAHDPFNPLPSAVKAASASSTPTSSSSTTSAPAASPTGSVPAGSGSSPKAETSPVAPSKPAVPRKPATAYQVSVLFGAVPAGTPLLTATLTPYENLKLLTPLPSGDKALIVFRSVTAGGKSASFTLVGEAILRGAATCVPSAAQCQRINLKPGQAEQLEYLPVSGPPVTYELRVASIAPSKASTAAMSRVLGGASKAGTEALRRAGFLDLAGLL